MNPIKARPRILVADSVAAEGIELMKKMADVDVATGLSPEELVARIADYSALVVRSETKVTRVVLEAATNLVVVGRAGVGVDNIDLEAATERGVLVVNAPQANTVAAAEHTIALLLSLARHVPQADASMRAGRWDRKSLVGIEIAGKTLGVLGLGKIGAEVVRRAIGLEMRVLGYDPFVLEERARAIGVELASFDDLIAQADFITVHVPLTTANTGLLGADQIARMKDGVRLINVARGGIIDEQALADAVDAGKVAGAAIDVFTSEPPGDSPILGDPRVIVTPHLGASTTEAQERVIVDVSEQIVEILDGQPARFAVNAPMLTGEALSLVGPYLAVAELLGSLATQLLLGQVESIEIDYFGEIAEHDVASLRAAIIRGLLSPISEENVSIVNADLVAHSRGLRIDERHRSSHEAFVNLIELHVKTSEAEVTVAGTIEHGQPHVVLLNELDVDIQPGPGSYLLVCDNEDRPGMIGKLGTLLGEFDINIHSMQVGRRNRRERAIMLIALDEAPDKVELGRIEAIDGIHNVRLIQL